MKEHIDKALEKIRPALKMDGGDIEVLEIDDENKTVKVRLIGSCAGCPMAQMTLQHHVEKILKEEVPELKEVIAV